MSQQRNVLTGGLSLTLRAWPALLWTYVFNVGLAVLFSWPLHRQLSAITAHSFAAQRLASGFDLGTLAGVVSKAGEGPGAATMGSFFSIFLYLVFYFLVVPGTLFCYQTGAPARLSTLLQTGILYFWRFVRVTLISLAGFVIVLGPLLALRKVWDAHVDEHIVGRSAMWHELVALILIGLVAAALRVYFDLVEVYTVQLGQLLRPAVSNQAARPDRRVRRALKPAWRTFRRNFFRIYCTFIFLALGGLSAVFVTARMAMHSLAQPRVWPMFLLAQVGLFLMLLTRFWQRGAETALALDSPILAELPVVVVVEEPILGPAPVEPNAIPLEE
ncbi:MAG TPA: hypothetical protein VFC39_02625 [Acidobacteriaceae bacterium]|nr:hypothetical protein [Acidobacteriaceae bacterium]